MGGARRRRSRASGVSSSGRSALLFILTGIDLVYHLAPAVRQRWYWLTPGSAFAGVAWAAVSLGLRAYVSQFANYNATYGSIGGVILLLLWLYLSGLALLIGGEVNSVIARAAAERGEEIAAPLDDPADPREPARLRRSRYLTISRSSTSKVSVAPGLIRGGAPRSP